MKFVQFLKYFFRSIYVLLIYWIVASRWMSHASERLASLLDRIIGNYVYKCTFNIKELKQRLIIFLFKWTQRNKYNSYSSEFFNHRCIDVASSKCIQLFDYVNDTTWISYFNCTYLIWELINIMERILFIYNHFTRIKILMKVK